METRGPSERPCVRSRRGAYPVLRGALGGGPLARARGAFFKWNMCGEICVVHEPVNFQSVKVQDSGNYGRYY
jgi:hypothetical protein